MASSHVPRWRRYMRFFGADVDADVDEEFRFHLETEIEELLAKGRTLDEARAEAVRRFGDLEQHRRNCRDADARRAGKARRTETVNMLKQDLRYAFRALRRQPVITAVAALSLGLGIGANAAIYSIFHRMLRQDLDVSQPERLVNLGAPGPKNGGQSCGSAGGCEMVFSFPMFRDLEERLPKSLTAIAGHRAISGNIGFERRAFTAGGLFVSGSYFPVLGIQPTVGRLLSKADDQTVGAHPVIVLSHYLWETRFDADPAVVGKTLMINGHALTIVGVAPKDFDGTTYGERATFFVPLAMGPTIGTGMERRHTDRRAYHIYVFGRLAPGATIEQARTGLNAVYGPILRDVELALQQNMADSVKPRFLAKQVLVEPGSRGQSDILEEAGGPLFMLFAITALVLLIACANIANLLMARATDRETEMAVRLSLGATRRRLLVQLLTESVTLAFLGGVASMAFASWTLRGITTLMPPDIVEGLKLGMNWAAVGFAAALSLATGLAFGLFPALHSTRPDLVTALRNNSGKLAGGRGARRFRTSLATAQVALAMTLLMTAGLFLKSLWNVSRVDLGVRIERLVTFGLSPQNSGYDSVRTRALYVSVEEALRSLPGTTAATSSIVPLIAGNNWNNGVKVEGFTPEPNARVTSSFNGIGSGYFKAIGVDMLAGREFSDADASGRPKVAIVNQAFAKRFGLGPNPVGKRMAMGRADSIPLDIEIVGLSRDTKYSSVKQEIPPVFFVPHRQDRNIGQLRFYVRTGGDPSLMLRAIPELVRRLDPMLPVEDLRTMEEEIRLNTFEDRMISTLSAAFALLATLLAAIGLYGVLAYSVAQRTREIGVRMALGAAASQVRGLVLKQTGVMVLIGGAIGLAGAYALSRAASSMLFQMSGADPVVMASAAVLLALVALAAGYVPARRASQVDPMQALRYE